MADKMVAQVYSAKSQDAQEAAYDDWAETYERDLCRMGYRAPWMTAAVFGRFVTPECGPILDAGCGGGLQCEPLAALGYGPITGIDLSEGMLSVARAKGLYAELRQMAMGSGLDFAPQSFGAVLSVGTITPGHAPASSFADLVTVTRPGGTIVISLRSDDGVGPEYWQACTDLETDGRWARRFSSDPFLAMPYSEPDVACRVHVFEVT